MLNVLGELAAPDRLLWWHQ